MRRYLLFAVLLGLGLLVCLFALRSPTRGLDESRGSCTVRSVPGPDAEVCWPDLDARPWEYFRTARDTCGKQSLEEMAKLLDAALPAPGSVASAYAAYIRRERELDDETKVRAVYAGCVEGFSR